MFFSKIGSQGSLVVKSISELMIIVVGILVALSADEWWANREERAEELEILQAIARDVVATQESVRGSIGEMRLALDDLEKLSEGSAGATADIDDGALAVLFANGLWETAVLTVQMSAYDEILNSGRLRLIDDLELRRRLAEYDRQLSLTMTLFSDVFHNQQVKLDPYLIANAQLSQMFSERAQRRADKPVRLDVVPSALDHRPLLADPVFLNQVAAKYYLMYDYHRYAVGLLTILDHLAVLTDARINEIRD